MMLFCPEFSEPIELSPEKIHSIVIENGGLLYRFVCDLVNQLEGKDGEAVLSNDNKVLDISKNMELITDIVRFEVSTKAVMNKIVSQITKRADEPASYEATRKLLAEIHNYFGNILWEFDSTLECAEVTIAQVVKAVNIRVFTTNDTLPDKILARMQVTREFLGERVFVFLNMRGYLSEEEMEQLAKTIVQHEFITLFIDDKETKRIKDEVRLIIDSDLCEIG